jgi:hypothetical protein
VCISHFVSVVTFADNEQGSKVECLVVPCRAHVHDATLCAVHQQNGLRSDFGKGFVSTQKPLNLPVNIQDARERLAEPKCDLQFFVLGKPRDTKRVARPHYPVFVFFGLEVCGQPVAAHW